MAYKFRDSTEDLYGPRAGEVPSDMKGGYISKDTPHAGRMYRGRVEVPLDNIDDARDMLVTLRHEVLGHYGANTFPPDQKRALLDGLIAAQQEPTLRPLWETVNQHYHANSLDERAEEVFALQCEGVAPLQHVTTNLAQQGHQAFKETCLDSSRVMTSDDLQNIACMVAQGMHDRSRRQMTFPQTSLQLRKKDADMDPKKPFHEVVAEKLIQQLKEGTAPWQKPWKPGEPSSMMPINPTTGKRYKGINAIQLMSQGRTDQRWMTFKQAVAQNAQVRKGERGTPIQYWKFSEEQDAFDEKGRPIKNGNGDQLKQTVKLERPRVFMATVFNAEQIEGLPEQQVRQAPQWDALERADQIVAASGAEIRHGENNRAFYRMATDSIHLPDKERFSTAANYYATTLHELGHWTGHEARLARDLSHPFGSEGYAKEELRAEIASMILGDELGIGHDPSQHVAYVGSWIKALEDDPLEIFRAAADAEKIQDYLLGLEQKMLLSQTQEPPKMVFFFGAENPLSNWHAARFIVDGVEFSSNEQYMMHSKAMLFGDRDSAQRILLSNNPAEQKALGRSVMGFDESVWNDNSEEIVFKGSLAKFTQNPSLGDYLVSTGDAELVEASPYDRIWGVGLAENDPRIHDKAAWLGDNKLGNVQMRARAVLVQLREENKNQQETAGQPQDPLAGWLLAELRSMHSDEKPHQSPLLAWERFEGMAKEFGLVASLHRGNPTGLPPYIIKYTDSAGNVASMKTSLYDQAQSQTSYPHPEYAHGGVLTSDEPWNRSAFHSAASKLIAEQQSFQKVVRSLEALATGATKTPEAFIDTNGLLKSWDSADTMPNEWEGLVKNEGAYWFAANSVGQRTFVALTSSTIAGAAAEAMTFKALTLDINAVLDNPDVSFNHYEAFQREAGEDLEQTLRRQGFKTIGDVTGREPAGFYETAHNRLSAVFGITPDHDETDNPYFERKGLAQAFAVKAEDMLAKLHRSNTQEHATGLPGAPQEQFPEPEPLTLVDRLVARGLLDRDYAVVASALRDYRTGTDDTHNVDRAALHEASMKAFAAQLPVDFTGQTQIIGIIERDGQASRADEAGEKPEAFQVYARKGDAQYGEDAYALMAQFASESDAQELADRLALIDALSQVNELDQVAKMARLNEEHIRRDPESTDEQKAAARHIREDADFKATRRELADLERRQSTAATPVKERSAPQPVGAYQAELARLLALSTLTPGSYVPTIEVKSASHAAVFVNEVAEILCGPSDDPASVALAESLASSAQVRHALQVAGKQGLIQSGVVAGEHIQWREQHSAIVSKRSGQVEAGGEHGPLLAIVLHDPEQALTAALCVQTSTARLFDADAPDLDDGRSLAALARGDAVPTGVKTYIDVPFAEKDEAKALGARWDRPQQSWYIPQNVNPSPFSKWAVQAPETPQAAPDGTRKYLAVPYAERTAAKAAGAEWDQPSKSWYAGPKADMAALARWELESVQNQQAPAMTPKQEFAEALRAMGCIVSGDHPVMDGSKQRIQTAVDRKDEKSGFYVAYLDGHPAGYIKNNRSGDEMRWSSKGYALDPEQRALMQAEAAQKLNERAVQQAKDQEQTANRVSQQMQDLVPVSVLTTYMAAKGIDALPGVFTDQEGKKTYIPVIDVDGKQWSMQYIQEDGVKRFAREGRKEGCFHAVGGLDALAAAPALVIGEGYATASTLSKSLGHATVAAFDAGNLLHVAKALHDKYPDKPIVVAGDDDRHLIITQGNNPGRSKAQECADAVGGKLLLPIFSGGENRYPARLDPVTPDQYKAHRRAEFLLEAAQMTDSEFAELSQKGNAERVVLTEAEAQKLSQDLLKPEQLQAIDKIKGHSDFNDLANKTLQGQEAIDRQVRVTVEAIVQKHQIQRTEEQQKQQLPQQDRRRKTVNMG